MQRHAAYRHVRAQDVADPKALAAVLLLKHDFNGAQSTSSMQEWQWNGSAIAN